MADGKPADNYVEPIPRPISLRDAAYAEIKEQLISGRLEPGQLYSAQHFATILGVSRTPAREALLQLASEGFLSCIDVRGFRVRQFSEGELRDVFETRQIIEAFVIKCLLDGDKLRPGDFQRLNETVRAMREYAQAEDKYEFVQADKEFHMALARRTGNSMLVRIMEIIRDYIGIFTLQAFLQPARFQELIREHRLILNALHRKDRKRALQVMRRHLMTTERILLEMDRPSIG
jgi:DNA-binding GntR family transcriptional regulator